MTPCSCLHCRWMPRCLCDLLYFSNRIYLLLLLTVDLGTDFYLWTIHFCAQWLLCRVSFLLMRSAHWFGGGIIQDPLSVFLDFRRAPLSLHLTEDNLCYTALCMYLQICHGSKWVLRKLWPEVDQFHMHTCEADLKASIFSALLTSLRHCEMPLCVEKSSLHRKMHWRHRKTVTRHQDWSDSISQVIIKIVLNVSPRINCGTHL